MRQVDITLTSEKLVVARLVPLAILKKSVSETNKIPQSAPCHQLSCGSWAKLHIPIFICSTQHWDTSGLRNLGRGSNASLTIIRNEEFWRRSFGRWIQYSIIRIWYFLTILEDILCLAEISLPLAALNKCSIAAQKMGGSKICTKTSSKLLFSQGMAYNEAEILLKSKLFFYSQMEYW